MSNSLGLKAHHITARVSNLATALEWYLKVLDLQLLDEGELLDGAIKYAVVALSGYSISLMQMNLPAVPGTPGAGAVPSWVHPVFSVPDPEQAYRELVSKGVRVATHGPKVTPVKSFMFYDCECNELEIVAEGAIH